MSVEAFETHTIKNPSEEIQISQREKKGGPPLHPGTEELLTFCRQVIQEQKGFPTYAILSEQFGMSIATVRNIIMRYGLLGEVNRLKLASRPKVYKQRPETPKQKISKEEETPEQQAARKRNAYLQQKIVPFITSGEWVTKAKCNEKNKEPDSLYYDEGRNGYIDPDSFFGEKATDQHRRKKICVNCPVKVHCLVDALEMGIDEQFGVWGGETEGKRRAMLKKNPDIGKKLKGDIVDARRLQS